MEKRIIKKIELKKGGESEIVYEEKPEIKRGKIKKIEMLPDGTSKAIYEPIQPKENITTEIETETEKEGELNLTASEEHGFYHDKIKPKENEKNTLEIKQYAFKNEKEAEFYLAGEKRLEQVSDFANQIKDNILKNWPRAKSLAKEVGVNLAALTTQEFWREGFNELRRSFKEDMFVPAAKEMKEIAKGTTEAAKSAGVLTAEFYQYEIDDNKKMFQEIKKSAGKGWGFIKNIGEKIVGNIKNIGGKNKQFFEANQGDIKLTFLEKIRCLAESGAATFEAIEAIQNILFNIKEEHKEIRNKFFMVHLGLSVTEGISSDMANKAEWILELAEELRQGRATKEDIKEKIMGLIEQIAAMGNQSEAQIKQIAEEAEELLVAIKEEADTQNEMLNQVISKLEIEQQTMLRQKLAE